MSDPFQPTTTHVTDALLAESEYEELLVEINRAGMALSVSAVRRILEPLGKMMLQQFPGISKAGALALVVTVAANQSAELIMEVQASHPVNDVVRDGRLRAVNKFFEGLFQAAVRQRAMALAAKKKGAEALANINARLQ